MLTETSISLFLPDIVYSSREIAFNPYSKNMDKFKIRITFSGTLAQGGDNQFLTDSNYYVLNLYRGQYENPIFLYSTKIFCTDQKVNPRENRPYTTNQDISENTKYSKQPSYITI